MPACSCGGTVASRASVVVGVGAGLDLDQQQVVGLDEPDGDARRGGCAARARARRGSRRGARRRCRFGRRGRESRAVVAEPELGERHHERLHERRRRAVRGGRGRRARGRARARPPSRPCSSSRSGRRPACSTWRPKAGTSTTTAASSRRRSATSRSSARYTVPRPEPNGRLCPRSPWCVPCSLVAHPALPRRRRRYPGPHGRSRAASHLRKPRGSARPAPLRCGDAARRRRRATSPQAAFRDP